MMKSGRFLILLTIVCMAASGCMRGSAKDETGESIWRDPAVELPELPEGLNLGEDGVPILKVYDTSQEQIIEESLEKYVTGVVAGEMKNDWPIEALKAQAILARTFVLKFCDTKESKYDDADISTDVSEAQAYAPENINERVRQAIKETRGIVMSDDGDYPYAWFFAHAGGKTELPSIALDFDDEDPDYLSIVKSPDSPKAPENVQNWSVTFSKEEVLRACADSGLKIGSIETVEIGEKGDSGRAKNLLINGESISAPTFRIAVGANKLKSTLLDRIEVSSDSVSFTGRGFGHGVGMSQWGAYALAEEGKSASEIIQHYFRDIDLVKLW